MCDMEVEAPGGGAGGDKTSAREGSAPATTGTSTRITRTGRVPPPAGGSPGEPKKKKRKPACKRDVCGLAREGGKRECYACGDPPSRTGSNSEVWRHYQSEEAAGDAKEVWDYMGVMEIRPCVVIDGREPKCTECYCDRPGCMFRSIIRARAARDTEQDVSCDICGKERIQTSRIKCIGPFLLGTFRACFAQPVPGNTLTIPTGSSLEASSLVCQGCYMKGWKYQDKQTPVNTPV